MVRVLFLLLILMNSIASAQIQGNHNQNETPKSLKQDEFGKTTDGEIKARLDNLFVKLASNPTMQAYIINYGSAREVGRREWFIRRQINFRQTDALKITFVNGGKSKLLKTVFWIVPEGAESPEPE